MSKVCQICGLLVGDKIRECPNCGSVSFITQKLDETRIKMRRFK